MDRFVRGWRRAPRVEDVEAVMRRVLASWGLGDAEPDRDPDGDPVWRYRHGGLAVAFRAWENAERPGVVAGRFSAALGELPATEEDRPRVLAIYRRMLELNYERIAVGSLGVQEALLLYDHVFELDRETLSALQGYLEWLNAQVLEVAEALRELGVRLDPDRTPGR